MTIVNLLFLSLLLISVVSLVFSDDSVSSIIVLNVFSLTMTVLYVIMNAPDVAITEASIGACLTTIFFLWTLMILRKENAKFSQKKSSKVHLVKNTLVVLLIGLFSSLMAYAFLDLPVYGSYDAPINNEIYSFYIDGTKKYFNFPNMVTAILAGFRGFDTLGETTVIFTAGLSVTFLLKRE